MKHSNKSLPVGLALGLLLGGTAQADADHAVVPDKSQLSKLCKDCAFVTEVHTETRQGKSSGVGMVGGALVGGLLANRLGGGNGKALATVGGAAAGGYAGNEIEKSGKKYTVWVVRLIYKDGSAHSRELGTDPQLRGGDVVLMQNGRLSRQ